MEMTRRIWYRDSREAMNAALDAAEDSNCNSRHLGTIVVDNEGVFVASGFNSTVDPICLLGFCHKKLEGQGKGHSEFCNAMHSEEMAAKKVMALEKMGRAFKRPLTAVCAMGYPCGHCLAALQAAGIERLVLLKDTFYTNHDEELWNKVFKEFFEVQIL